MYVNKHLSNYCFPFTDQAVHPNIWLMCFTNSSIELILHGITKNRFTNLHNLYGITNWIMSVGKFVFFFFCAYSRIIPKAMHLRKYMTMKTFSNLFTWMYGFVNSKYCELFIGIHSNSCPIDCSDVVPFAADLIRKAIDGRAT